MDVPTPESGSPVEPETTGDGASVIQPPLLPVPCLHHLLCSLPLPTAFLSTVPTLYLQCSCDPVVCDIRFIVSRILAPTYRAACPPLFPWTVMLPGRTSRRLLTISVARHYSAIPAQFISANIWSGSCSIHWLT